MTLLRRALTGSTLLLIVLVGGSCAGELYVRQNRATEARREFETLAGWAYYQKGLYSFAIRTLSDVATIQPENPLFHYHLGMAQAGITRARFTRTGAQAQPGLSGCSGSPPDAAEASVLI